MGKIAKNSDRQTNKDLHHDQVKGRPYFAVNLISCCSFTCNSF